MSSQPAPDRAPSRLSSAQWASHLAVDASFEDGLDTCAAAVAAHLERPPDVVFAFVAGHPATRVKNLPALLRKHVPATTTILGCTAGGVIGGGQEVEGSAAVSLTAATLPGVGMHAFHLEAEDIPDLDGPPGAWETWVGIPHAATPSFILLPDPFTFDIEGCLRGLDYAYPGRPKIGGMASGSNRPGGNLLFHNDQVWHHGMAGLAFTGPLRVDPLVAQGCRPIGRPMIVTECQQNVLLSLDHQRPVAILESLLPDLNERDRRMVAGSLFLGFVHDPFKTDLKAGDFLIRNLLGLDAQTGALAVGSLLRVGQRVQFHLRDAQSSAQELDSLVLAYREGQPDPVAAALLFSCLGRGKHLYGVANHDPAAFERGLGKMPVGGFFCAGEIGPIANTSYIHGYTSSFAIFRH